MTQNKRPKHYGTFEREEVLVLGHDQRVNDLLILKLNHVPMGEKHYLLQIVNSMEAQNNNYLSFILDKHTHPETGKKWFDHLVLRYMANNSGAMLRAPIKDVSDMNDEQIGIYKGYIKPTTTLVDAPNAVSNVQQPVVQSNDNELKATLDKTNQILEMLANKVVSLENKINSEPKVKKAKRAKNA